MFKDNPIIIDVSRKRNRQQKACCVLCNNEKIELECFNSDENRYRCPRCKNTYQIGFEILPQEDILESSHEVEDDGAILLCADDEFKEKKSTDSIPVPKYFKDSETTKVEYYREG